MLQSMRAASQSWVMRVFFAVLVFAFVILWGVGDVFRPGGMSAQYVATVGKKTITTHEFVRSVQSMSRIMQMRTGQQPDENTIKIAALQNLIRTALLDQEADRLGLAVSDQQLRTTIRTSPSFQDKTGNFNKQIFEAIARAEGLTEKDLTEKVREQLKHNQLLQLIAGGLQLPESYIHRLFKWQNETRKVDWIEVPLSAAKTLPQPTEEQMKKYYEENAEEFTLPETRDVTVLLLTADQLKEGIQLTDEEIQTGFAQRQEQTGGKLPSKQESDQILAELKAEKVSELLNQVATQIEDNLAAGTSLEEIAEQNKLKLIKIEGLQRDGDAKAKPDISAYALVEAVEEGFKQETGEDPTLSQLENGEFIALRVDRISESKLQPFEEVRAEVIRGTLSQLHDQAAKKLAQELVEQINQGKPIVQIAKQNKLKLNSAITLDRTGRDNQKASQYLRYSAFTTEINKAALAPEENGYAVVVPRQKIEVDPAGKPDELKAFASILERAVSEDLQNEYLTSLHNRFPVDYNEAVLKQLEQ